MAKKIVIIDGGPRKTFNLAQLFEQFKQGVHSVDETIEIEHIRLYDLDFKGCISCMGCKLAGGKNYGRCIKKDDLTHVLESLKTTDGVVFGSPVYYMDISGEFQSALERIIFPYGNYKTGVTEKADIPTATFYTMNASEEYIVNPGFMKSNIDRVDMCIGMRWQQPVRLTACCTQQVKDYSRYEFSDEWAQAHIVSHEQQFPKDLQRAFEIGKQMAEQIG